MKANDLTILIGTTKGAFLIAGGGEREDWNVDGPFCDGWPINHIVGDVQTGMFWAGGGWHGAGIWRSEDGGESWNLTRLTGGRMGRRRSPIRRGDRMDRRAFAVRRRLLSDPVVGPCSRHTLRRDETGRIARQPG